MSLTSYLAFKME